MPVAKTSTSYFATRDNNTIIDSMGTIYVPLSADTMNKRDIVK
jgi:hypothetical protein